MDRPTNPGGASPVDLRATLDASGWRMTRRRATAKIGLRLAGRGFKPTGDRLVLEGYREGPAPDGPGGGPS